MFYSYLWDEKYMPKSIEELHGNKNDINGIIKLLQDIKKKKNVLNGIILNYDTNSNIKNYIKILLNHCNYSFQEISYEELNDSKFEQTLNDICYRNITDIFNNKCSAIIITENIKKKKNFEVITKYLKNNKYIPVICLLCNNTINITKYKNNYSIFNIQNPNDIYIFKFIKNIAINENILINDTIISILVNKCNNDLNRVFLILENIKTFYNNQKITLSNLQESLDVITNKDIDINSYGFIKTLHTKEVSSDFCINYYESNQGIIHLFSENFFNNIYQNNNNLSYKLLLDYYEKLSESSMIEKFVFDNRKWGLSCYSGILGLKYPNYILMSNNIITNNIKINNSSILSKLNYFFYNLKFINEITKKINISLNQFQLFTSLLYDYFILNKIDCDIKKQKFIKLLKSYNFAFNNFDKSLKLSYLYCTYEKLYTNKLKKQISDIFN